MSAQKTSPPKRFVRYNVAVTLDGFIASKDGLTDWIVEDAAIDLDALYAEFSTFVMGRKTYEALLKYGNPLASRPKDAVVVITKAMKPEDHPNITVETGDPQKCLRELREKKGVIFGSWAEGSWLDLFLIVNPLPSDENTMGCIL
ncbi:hypothetical protein QBC37DRAFT_407334 [Rhypophila decipiens]|uniref:2,5-diamino-6-ribosylamino-4(3H)-pyrimidinone 5'-phosphate reductase n=1 Tax=Rhypophila decipiens TaxID=261697 RepID=A0AAN6XT82_9PEZI|nr:hypothetical protein QBC37DRAFT_407334 [Rhypophila decipiens]